MKKTIFTLFAILIIILVFGDRQVRHNIKLDFVNFVNNFLPVNNKRDFVMESFSFEQISQARVTPDNIISGNIEKDDIPSLMNPKFDEITNSKFSDNELIIGVYLNGEARAYPHKILYHHEIINDTIGDTPIAVTLCPLCNTDPVFKRIVDGEITTFGVSGKLFNSCLVMHDRKTGTLWSQPWGIGIMGAKNNYILERIPTVSTTLGDWKKKYSNTKILSLETGYNRNYSKYPYANYNTSTEIKFPIRNQDKLIGQPKDLISYIWQTDDKTPTNNFSGESYKILYSELKEKHTINFIFNNKSYSAVWDNELQTPRFFDDAKTEIPASTAYAFVYPAYFQ